MMRAGLACLFDLFMSPGPIGAHLATVRRNAAFRWFALVETERESTAAGGAVLRFRPERGAPVELALKLDARERVTGMTLAIEDAFLAHPTRPFALDALKTALAALARGRGAPAPLGALATHLEAEMGAPVSPPAPSAEVAAALAVVAGRTRHWRAEGRRFAVSLGREGGALVLSAPPMTPGA